MSYTAAILTLVSLILFWLWVTARRSRKIDYSIFIPMSAIILGVVLFWVWVWGSVL